MDVHFPTEAMCKAFNRRPMTPRMIHALKYEFRLSLQLSSYVVDPQSVPKGYVPQQPLDLQFACMLANGNYKVGLVRSTVVQ